MSRVEAYTRLAGVYDEIVVDPGHDRLAAFLHELWTGSEPAVHTVLDVCCGTGLLAAALIQRGYEVVGVDASDAMLARARALLGPEVRLERTILPDLAVEGTFDAAVSTFDGFTYLAPAELRSTVAALAQRVRPGGWLVFDLHTDAQMQFTVANPVVEGEKDGSRFVITSVVDPAARTCDTTIEVAPADGAPFSEEHRQHFHRPAEVRAALGDAGFEVFAVNEEYTDRPADESTLCTAWISRRGLRGLATCPLGV